MSRGDRALRAALVACFEAKPVESGLTHPAEAVMSQALGDPGLSAAMRTMASDPTFRHCASLATVVGRMPEGRVASWGYAWMVEMLSRPDLETRDAAVKALELWGTDSAYAALEDHAEPVAWLEEYIARLKIERAPCARWVLPDPLS